MGERGRVGGHKRLPGHGMRILSTCGRRYPVEGDP